MMFANIPMFFSSLLRGRLQQCRSLDDDDDDDDQSAARCSPSSYTALLLQARQQLKDLDENREDVSSTEDCSDVSIDFLKKWEQRIPVQRKPASTLNKQTSRTTKSTASSSSTENEPITVKTESHLQRKQARDSTPISNRSLPVIPFYSLRDHFKDDSSKNADEAQCEGGQRHIKSERSVGFPREEIASNVCRIPEQIEFPSDWSDDDESNEIVLDPIDPIYYGELPWDMEHLESLADEMLKLLHEHLLHPEIDIIACRLSEFIVTHPSILCQIKYPPPTHQDAENEELCYPLAFASVTGHLSVIKAALNAYPEAMRPDPHLGTPAHYAAYHRASAAALRELCRAAPEAAKATNRRHHQTPLHLACAATELRRETDFVQGIDRASITTLTTTASSPKSSYLDESLSSSDESSQSVITACAVLTVIDFECVQVLVSYYPTAILLPDRQGWTPLHYACEALHAPVVQYFCALHPTAARATTITGQTPLHIAVSVTKRCSEATVLSVVEILLKSYHAGAFAMDHMGQTALHKAALFARHRKRVIELLLQANPLAMEVSDEEGIRPEQLLNILD